MVKGLSTIVESSVRCEAYVLSKQHRHPFKSSNSRRAREPLELVYTNLCGPMQTISICKSQYFMTFIDEYNHKTWVYLLQPKSKGFEKLKVFKAQDEKESGHFIKV